MNKAILRLALPNILSNISVPLLSAVDVALMGNLSVIHLGAIGLSTMIFNFFFWNFGFLRMGTTGMIAQAHGSESQDAIDTILSKAIYLAGFIAISILLLQIPIGRVAESLLKIGDLHRSLVWDYFFIRIWAAPATLLTYCFYGYLFGRQNALYPMIVTIVVNVSNIILSYYLVVNQGLGIRGAAIGTLAAEVSGVIILFAIIRRKYGLNFISFRLLSGWRSFLKVNSDLFIRTIALTTAFGFFYRESSAAGELILATNVVILQYLSWMSYGIDGFAFASESLIGMYHGKKDEFALHKCVKYSFVWAFGLATGFGLVFGGFYQPISEIFTDSAEVIEMIAQYRWWLLVLPLLAFSSYMWDGIFIGLTRTAEMRNTMVVSLITLIMIYYAFINVIENAIWLSFMIFLFIRGVLLTINWIRIRATVLVK